ncbi:unnamed protein product, partial [Hapterophycus canaliculatus]
RFLFQEATTRLIALQFGGLSPSDQTPPSAVWALDCLMEPVAVRFRFHFEEDRPTNRVDR